MISIRHQFRGVVPWLRHGVIFCWVSLLLIGGFAEAAQAARLYAAARSWEPEDVGAGTGQQPATVLIVLYGEHDELEQRLHGVVANPDDVSLYPQAHFSMFPMETLRICHWSRRTGPRRWWSCLSLRSWILTISAA